MKKKTAILIAAIALPIVLTLCSCNKSHDKSLTMIDFVKIDEETKPDTVLNSFIGSLVFSPIMFNDYEKGKFHTHYILAEDVKVLPGKRSVEVRLRDGVRFHGGRPLTSADMVASFKRIRDEHGDEKFKGLEAEIVDRLRFRLCANNPLSDPNTLLAHLYALPPSGSAPFTGTGPFKFTGVTEDGLELKANNDYFEGRPKLDRIVYFYEPDEDKRVAGILKGEADLLLGLPSGSIQFFENDPKYRVKREMSNFYMALFLNTNSPFFNDRSVRRAVNMAIDKDAMIEKLHISAAQACGPFLEEMLPDVYDCQPYPYRPKEAARILQSSGWKDGNGDGILENKGRDFMVALYYFTDEELYKDIANMIARQLYEVGIGAKAMPISYSDFMKKEISSEYYDAVLSSSNIFMPNAEWQSRSKHDGVSANSSHYENADIDGLLEELKRTENIREQKKIYGLIDRMLHEDAPAVFLYNPAFYFVVQKRFIGAEGFDGSGYGFYKIKDWDIRR